MTEFARDAATERVETLVKTVESETMPVPVRELWVYGDLALGLDPVARLDIYLTKDLLFHGDSAELRSTDHSSGQNPQEDDEREAEFIDSHGVEGIGKTVSAEWATEHPEYIRANANGYVAPERCLAAHLIGENEPIHLEVCNANFEDNVTQRLRGAMARENYEEILDPRGVCLWLDGQRSEEAFDKLRNGEFVFPTLADSLSMVGVDESAAERAASAVKNYRERQQGATVRGDVV